jgi:transposase
MVRMFIAFKADSSIATTEKTAVNVREFYSKLPRPVLVGIEATGSMYWFLNLMEELGIECRVGHPA